MFVYLLQLENAIDEAGLERDSASCELLAAESARLR